MCSPSTSNGRIPPSLTTELTEEPIDRLDRFTMKDTYSRVVRFTGSFGETHDRTRNTLHAPEFTRTTAPLLQDSSDSILRRIKTMGEFTLQLPRNTHTEHSRSLEVPRDIPSSHSDPGFASTSLGTRNENPPRASRTDPRFNVPNESSPLILKAGATMGA